MTKTPQKRSSRRRCCCWLIPVTLLILMLVGFGAFRWFYDHPISNENIHTRVLNRLERISGLNVKYDSASLTLSTGEYVIKGLRFLDPAKPQTPVLTVEEIDATIMPWQFIFNPESVLKKVVLKNPSRLDLVYSENSVKLGDQTSFLVETVKRAQPPGIESSGRLPFDSLKIENVDVAFTESDGILPGLTPTSATALMRGDMTIKNHNAKTLEVTFTGNASRPRHNQTQDEVLATGLKAVTLIGTSGTLNVSGSVEKTKLTNIFRELPDASLNASDILYNLDINSHIPNHNISGSVQFGNVSVVSPNRTISLADKNVRLKGNIDLQTSTSLVNMKSLSLNSDGAQLALSGLIDYKRDKQYNISLSTDRFSGQYREMINDLLPEGWNLDSTANGVAGKIHVTGVGNKIDNLTGKLALRGVTLKSPSLPASLKNMIGDIIFAKDSIRLTEATGEYGGARVALDGVFLGDIWQKKSGKLELKWSAAVSLEEILKLHGSNTPAGATGLSGSGKIKGNGTWHQDIDLNNKQVAGMPVFEGTVDFDDISLKSDLLPAPISDLSGKAAIDDNMLEIQTLSGKMQGSELAVKGFVSGDKYFWNNPVASATLASKLDLSQIGQYLTDEQKANLNKYEISGHAKTEMKLSGPIKDLASNFTGAVDLNNVHLRPHLEFMKGDFSEISGMLKWNGKTLTLQQLSGKINDEKIDLSGSLSASKIQLQVKTKAPLQVVQKTFPHLDKYLRTSGGMDTDLTFSAGNNSDDPAQSIGVVLEKSRLLADNAVKNKTFTLNGELKFNDATIRHIAMPIAHTENGRKFPEGKVQNLTGTVYVKNDTLNVPADAAMRCSFSDTENCKLSGSIQLRQGDFPAMKVNISTANTLKLDTWVLGWGKEFPELDKPPVTGKKFDMEADIVAPSIVFRGQQAGRSRGKIIFHMTQDKTPRTTQFRDIVVQGNAPGQGRIIGNGSIESYVWNPQRFPHWHTSLDVQSMPLESMLTAVFKEPSNIRGAITGKVELQGVNDNPLSIQGSGSGYMTNLEIGGTAVIRQLGQTTGRNFGSTLFQTAQAANFQVGNGALSSRDLALETNGLQLEMRGDYWFAGNPAKGIAPKTIDGALRLRLFKSVFGSIPIIGQVADLADEVANAFLLAFKVTGTADNPRIAPVALPLFQGGT